MHEEQKRSKKNQKRVKKDPEGVTGESSLVGYIISPSQTRRSRPSVTAEKKRERENSL